MHYPVRLSRVREGLSLMPGVAFYNVFSMSNFNPFLGTLLNTSDCNATSCSPGNINGPTTFQGVPVLNSNRIERSSGTFDAGGPRTTEFQLKLNF